MGEYKLVLGNSRTNLSPIFCSRQSVKQKVSSTWFILQGFTNESSKFWCFGIGIKRGRCIPQPVKKHTNSFGETSSDCIKTLWWIWKWYVFTWFCRRAEIGYSTVDLITRRVIIAVLDTNLRVRHIHWPIGQEGEIAKKWVEDQTCSAFRNGWCMVDGTTISIFEKPHYFGVSFYDWKVQYSINAPIINTPNRQVIAYATGFNGSRLDTHCFGFTRLSKHHEDLLPNGKWCWGDVKYLLQSWLMIPYKIPNRTKENRDFNYSLSRVRIQNEHVIGYLKERF